MESTTIRFEWVLRGVGELFDGSKGETKSKVTRSSKFGGGQWQVLFYANSGTSNPDGQGFVSLYLSCEPTTEERDCAVDGQWVREGVYKFGFELRNLQKTILFNAKEANDHEFSYKTVNWGWAQFARRDAIYYQATSVRNQDAFVVICTITSAPKPPAAPPAVPRHLVPRPLLDSMGSLLDDPDYSDVEFVLTRKRGRRRDNRVIYAARKLLRRVEYFDIMFLSAFAEGQSDEPSNDVQNSESTLTAIETSDVETVRSEDDDDDELSGNAGFARRFEDSDDEDDDEDSRLVPDEDVPIMNLTLPRNKQHDDGQGETDEEQMTGRDKRQSNSSWVSVSGDDQEEADTGDQRNVRPKLSHPATPTLAGLNVTDDRIGSEDVAMHSAPRDRDDSAIHKHKPTSKLPGPKKIRVVIQDAAYHTYRAVLYYIYTVTIVFAPLSSQFVEHHLQASVSSPNIPQSSIPAKLRGLAAISTPAAATTPELQSQTSFLGGHIPSKPSLSGSEVTITMPQSKQPSSRREWIAEWERLHPGRPRPCSAKAVYRLADRLDLPDLKARAFQHIMKCLTVDNVAYEVFSDFSAAFEEVRKVEVAFFLSHWADIRGSESMRNVWQQIRLGKHPGFEEIWPLIAINLEFKPISDEDKPQA